MGDRIGTVAQFAARVLRHYWFVAWAATAFLSGPAFALTCQSNASASWTLNTTWINCGGGTPGALDDVQIRNANQITIPNNTAVAAKSVTFTVSNGAAALTHGNSGSTITIGSGGLTINASGTNATRAWNINAGSATVNGMVTLVEGTNNSRISRIAITTGSLVINGVGGTDGNLVMTNASNAVRTVVNVSGAGNITLTGSFNLSAGLGTLVSAAGSTFTYTSSSSANVATGSAIAYLNVTINKTGGIATTLDAPAAPRAFTVAGNLTVSNGTLNVANVTAAITGTTTVSGALGITGATGTKTFTGLLTVNATGTWNNSANAGVTLNGGITNNGTFASGTGTYIFATTASQALNGTSITFDGNVQVNNGITLTNNIATTIQGDFVGGGGAGSSTGTFTNAANSTLNIAGTMAGLVTLNASATDNTVNYIGAAVRTTKFSSYYHLAINSSGTVTLAGSTTIAGNLTTNGNFDPSANSRLVTFNGTVPQSIIATGGATNLTFYNLTLNNTSAGAVNQKLTAGLNVTVNNQLVFTSGRIVPTGTNRVIIPAAGSIVGAAGSPGNRFVAGRLQMFVNNGNPTVTFAIGTDGTSEPALGYSPITMAFSFVAGLGGNLIAYATLGDHPQIASSTLDGTKSVNRYWTLALSGGAGDLGSFTADTTLAFINQSPSVTDVDSGANPLNFEIERWDGAAWNTAVFGTRTLTTTQVLTVTTLGDFAVAERTAGGSPAGGFNAMDVTPTCTVSGFIKTKVSGSSVTLNVVALSSPPTSIKTNFNGTVRVELVDSSNTGLTCTTWPRIQLLPDLNFGPTDNGCNATPAFSEPNAWRNVRVRITNNPGKPSEMIACSGDNFAIRPSSITLSVTDADWSTAGGTRSLTNTDPAAAPVHKAGQPFRITVTPQPGTVTQYDGSPTVDTTTTACLLTGITGCATGTINLPALAWTGTNIRVNDSATYSEAGSFTLGLVDQAFANVDASDPTPADCSTSGRYICGASATGRFVPHHFSVAPAPGNTPSFQTFGLSDSVCGPGLRSFTYVGQPFGYATLPKALVTALNASGSITTNYRESLWKITTALPSDITQAYSNNSVGPALDTSLAANTPTVVPLNDGTGTVEVSTLDRISYQRMTPIAPFNSNISLTITAQDDAEAGAGQGVITATSVTPFSAIAFDSGNVFRFGRLRVSNAMGSPLLKLPVLVEAQYFTGTPANAFVTNTGDSCTSIAAANIAMGNFRVLQACDTAMPVSEVGALATGRRTMRLSAPGAGKKGSVDLTVVLGAASGETTCTTQGGGTVPVVSANAAYLQGNWGSGSWSQNPTARAAFSVYSGSGEVIDIREGF